MHISSPPRFGNIYQLGPKKADAYYEALYDMTDARDEKLDRFLGEATGETNVRSLGYQAFYDSKGKFYVLTANGVDDAKGWRDFHRNQIETDQESLPAKTLSRYVQDNPSRVKQVSD